MTDFGVGVLMVAAVLAFPAVFLLIVWAAVDGPRAVWQWFFRTRFVHEGIALTLRETSARPFLTYEVREPSTGAKIEFFLMDRKWHIHGTAWCSDPDFNIAVRRAADRVIKRAERKLAAADQRDAARRHLTRWGRDR